MPSVTFSYDGGMPGTVVATITGATVGWYYELNFDAAGSTVSDTAVSSTLVLTATDVAGGGFHVAGDQFGAILWTDEGGDGEGYLPVAATHFIAGTASGGTDNPGDLVPTFDHTTGLFTLSLTPRGRDTDLFSWNCFNDDFDSGGGSSSLSFTIPLGSCADGDFVFLQVRNPTHSAWFDDVASWWVFADSDTVYGFAGGPVPVPATHICS